MTTPATDVHQARDRLLAAAARYLSAERGGLDGADGETELANADAVLIAAAHDLTAADTD